jgi:hypothetical protein
VKGVSENDVWNRVIDDDLGSQCSHLIIGGFDNGSDWRLAETISPRSSNAKIGI